METSEDCDVYHNNQVSASTISLNIPHIFIETRISLNIGPNCLHMEEGAEDWNAWKTYKLKLFRASVILFQEPVKKSCTAN